MKKPLNIAIIVLVVLLVIVGITFAVMKAKSATVVSGTVDYQDSEPEPVDITIQDAYNQGADDANKQREMRERTALLTGGFSEVGRLLGIKPFG